MLIPVVVLSITRIGDYCLSKDDLVVAYTTPGSQNQLFDGGWTSKGGGGVASKSAFNLLGGQVDFDIDLSRVHTGVNANIYTIRSANVAPNINPALSTLTRFATSLLRCLTQ